MKDKHILIGITSASSYVLLKGSLEYLISKGYRVSLVSEYSDELLKISKVVGFEFYQVRIKREISFLTDLLSFFELLYLLHKLKPSICNFGTPKIALLGVIASRVLNIKKVIYTCRGIRYYHETGFKRQLLKFFEKITITCAHRTLFIAPSLESFIKEEFDIDRAKFVSILPGSSNGVDLTYFNPSSFENIQMPTDFTSFLNSVERPFVVTFVGRIIDRKGWRELYSAHKLLQSRDNSLLLVFVGNVEYEQISDLKLVEELKADKSVYITGWVHDIRPYLSKTAVLVNPSYWEGFGNVFLQAAACGIPVIAGSSLGCIDAISDGFNGFLVDPFSSVDIASKLLLFRDDNELLKKMGQNGIIFASDFHSEKIWNQYISLYESTF
jgi:glycosyltransferase involved in cell wall biosynthesis